MAEHSVGLDIGTFGVRAAEVSGEPGNLTLHRFAQLSLPPGAVVDGEIIDVATVTEALKQLWTRGDFKSKKVTVGVANRWVKVREAEVPALSPDDVRNSLRYEAQEVIPFPEQDAVVDFVVQDRYPGPDGGEFLRILVVAAQRQMLLTTLEAVRGAGLVPERIDLTPFALVRALAPTTAPNVSEAIVSIGAGLTNVVVHTGGTPRLVRMTPRAGMAVTENVTRTMGVDSDRAEALKRGAAVALADPELAQASDIVAAELAPLVQEIQGSLDYFLAQTDGVELRRVLLTGSGAKMAGLRSRLAAELRVPVEMASPLEYLRLGKTGLTEEQLSQNAAALAAPVGLAMAPWAMPSTRLTALFPTEYASANDERRVKALAAVGVGALGVVLLGAWGMRIAQVQSAKHGAQVATERAAAIEVEVQKLIPLEQAEAQIIAQRLQIEQALATDVDLPLFMDTLAAQMPQDTNWSSFQFAIAAPTAGPPGTAGAAATQSIGTITVSGTGLSHDSTAHWITKMRELGVLSSLWVPSSAKGAENSVTFSSNADITPAAKSHRIDKYRAGTK